MQIEHVLRAAEQHAIDDVERGDVDADSERERAQDEGGDGRFASEAPRRVASVLPDGFPAVAHLHVTIPVEGGFVQGVDRVVVRREETPRLAFGVAGDIPACTSCSARSAMCNSISSRRSRAASAPTAAVQPEQAPNTWSKRHHVRAPRGAGSRIWFVRVGILHPLCDLGGHFFLPRSGDLVVSRATILA